MHTGDDDLRLADGLRNGLPGAVGHVYNAYGPELFEYARTLLDDHDAAVNAVRAALLASRADPEGVPGPDRFRDWLHGLVLKECEGRGGPPAAAATSGTAAGQRPWAKLVVVGVAATAVTLTAGLMLMPGGSGRPRPNAPVNDIALPSPTTSATPVPSPSASKKPSPEPSKKKRRAEPTRRKATRGRLSIGAGGCQGVGVAGMPRTCRITLTAKGGPVRWSVGSVSSSTGRVRASGGGRLSAGESASVTVTISPTIRCYIRGRGSGSVSFSPGGTASVSYTCWRR